MFRLTLENATPISTVTFVTGVADPSPSVMVGDGMVGIDLSAPFILWSAPPAPLTTDLAGEASMTFSVPAGPLGISIAAGWGYIDAGVLRVSNVLSANL